MSLVTVLVHYGLLEGLTKKGQNHVGPCPFCESRSSRQFQINAGKGAWYCFGCKAGGNVLDFVAKREGVSVREAALLMDGWFDLGLVAECPPEVAPAFKARDKRQGEPEGGSQANRPLTFTLKTLDPAHASLKTLGLSASTIERFGLGYCAKGLQKGRVAIPIRNAPGELVAYVGLLPEAKGSDRYLFPPAFQPALEVFNLDRLNVSTEECTLYVVPEVLDVLRLAEAGVPNVLGLFDGTLSAAQEEAIRNLLPPSGSLVLVGDTFPERTVARLARIASVSWLPTLPAADPKAATEEVA